MFYVLARHTRNDTADCVLCTETLEGAEDAVAAYKREDKEAHSKMEWQYKIVYWGLEE